MSLFRRRSGKENESVKQDANKSEAQVQAVPDMPEDAEAVYQLGRDYSLGRNGKERSDAQAFKCYEKASAMGHVKATVRLGNAYIYGWGTEEDERKGRSVLSGAVVPLASEAGSGDPDAQALIGNCYEKGYGVTQSYADAVHWYEKAADQGFARAQCNLGYCYEKGYGVTQSYADAVHWYEKAADQGDANAQYNLGVCHANGYGVGMDEDAAVSWYRKAAVQGDQNARNALTRRSLTW